MQSISVLDSHSKALSKSLPKVCKLGSTWLSRAGEDLIGGKTQKPTANSF
jgi:hypothetical protein